MVVFHHNLYFILFTVRSLDLFYKLFLIDVHNRKATQLCPFVRSGIMHKAFHKYLRQDGCGIDYSFLENYDTKTVLEDYLVSQHPYWIKYCNSAIDKKRRGELNECLSTSSRIKLDIYHPDLIDKVKDALNHAS
jgi:hypothetical protein